eukprot:jgi/Chlat1/1165/Chrsp112S08648
MRGGHRIATHDALRDTFAAIITGGGLRREIRIYLDVTVTACRPRPSAGVMAAEREKKAKYRDHANSDTFIRLAIETHGWLGALAVDLLSLCAQRMADARELESRFVQRLVA